MRLEGARVFKGVRALAVYVTDKERAKRFYTETLGFELVNDLGPDLCFLRSNNGEIFIYVEGGKRKVSVENQDCRLSFFLEAEQKAGEAFATLKAKGVRLLQDTPEQVSDEDACFQFLDPDGNIIEVSGKF